MSITDSNHITPNEVALCAEAIQGKKYDQLPPELRQHLSHCDQCASEVLLVCELALDVNPFGIQKSKKFPSARIWIPLLVAAAMIAFIFLVIPYNNTENQNNALVQSSLSDTNSTLPPAPVIEDKVVPELILQRQSSTDNPDTVKVINDKKVVQPILASFTPSEDLERLYENFQGAYRGNQIAVKSTGITRNPEQDSLFWDNPMAKEISIEIFNNADELIFTQNTISWALPLPELSPGLYYWKLIEQQDYDLLYVGKIIKE